MSEVYSACKECLHHIGNIIISLVHLNVIPYCLAL